jgi:hypothetical protein
MCLRKFETDTTSKLVRRYMHHSRFKFQVTEWILATESETQTQKVSARKV